MNLGRVYEWTPSTDQRYAGSIVQSVVPLPNLLASEDGVNRLSGLHVDVRNGGVLNEIDRSSGTVVAVQMGSARPDREGNFLFEPGRGGGRMDKVVVPDPDFRHRYEQAARFGEVHTYFHIDRIATTINALLRDLGSAPLPPVTAVVCAHNGVAGEDGSRDGICRDGRGLAFQGGHYRLPARAYDMSEPTPIAVNGEIHLGPGRQLCEYGALAEAAGSRYRANASHNAGIIYHEYGHHINRHTADFRANALRPSYRQNNRKTAIDEGTSDYWAAAMLGTPHIWAWHHRHDETQTHPRSLTSAKTMADFVVGPEADPHANGTIWAAALWDFREKMSETVTDGARKADLAILQAMLLIGQLGCELTPPIVAGVRSARLSFAAGVRALLDADARLNRGENARLIREVMDSRGIDIHRAPTIE